MTHQGALAVEKIKKGGRHAATRLSIDDIMAMAELALLLAQKLADLDPEGIAAALEKTP